MVTSAMQPAQRVEGAEYHFTFPDGVASRLRYGTRPGIAAPLEQVRSLTGQWWTNLIWPWHDGQTESCKLPQAPRDP